MKQKCNMSKESTPLQAFENIIETFWDQDTKDIKTVRNTLKAVEMINEKKWLVEDILNAFIEDKEKYNFLKEVLL